MESANNSEDKLDKPSVLGTLHGELRTKLFNKIYFYVLVSFFVLNWQEIIILIKTKEDIYYTLSMIFTGQSFCLPFIGDFFLSPWSAHFGLPLVTGLIVSLGAPFVTYNVSKFTSKWFAKIRREDGMADLEVENEYQKLRASIADKTKKANNLEQENLELQKENELLLSKNKTLQERRVDLFYGIKAFVDCYDENKGIHTRTDIIDFLTQAEHTDFYRDESIIRKLPKLIEDLKKNYVEGLDTLES
ncbi:hypothetical protein [Hafnia alvei]|uniref:hypothetical protein n=1 Tax=Hafnia alvei TaxID=569 RepID=UPI0011AAAD9D|nr:hypothetical protein [Hafnia alvei]